MLDRDLDQIANEKFDVAIIGGGIYGACTLLEASRRGLKAVLVESEDFGGLTSWNSLRIIHGGLRYLQTADLKRFYRSVSEQAWWLKNFPDLLRPLPCLMPLYNKGLRRTNVLRAALKMNDLMAQPIRRRFGVQMEPSRILSVSETIDRFPDVDRKGLCGAALWFDCVMDSPQRLLMEVLRWSASAGGRALNYVQAEGLDVSADCVRGLLARCSLTNSDIQIASDYVINCAGPRATELESRFAMQIQRHGENSVSLRNESDKGLHLARAFSVVVNRAAIATDALAVSSPNNTYFCVPLSTASGEEAGSTTGKTMIGTVHLPPSPHSKPTQQELLAFIDDVNLAVPKLELSESDIVEVLPGRLPNQNKGSHLPRKSPKMSGIDGLSGFLTVEGVKYTTARNIAESALRKVLRQAAPMKQTGRRFGLPHYEDVPRPDPNELIQDLDQISASHLQTWTQHEAVVHVDDLLLRRMDLGFPTSLEQIAKRVMTRLAWSEDVCEAELKRIETK